MFPSGLMSSFLPVQAAIIQVVRAPLYARARPAICGIDAALDGPLDVACRARTGTRLVDVIVATGPALEESVKTNALPRVTKSALECFSREVLFWYYGITCEFFSTKGFENGDAESGATKTFLVRQRPAY